MSLSGNIAALATRIATEFKSDRAALAQKAPLVHMHTVSQISDASATGASVIKAATPTAARNVVGLYDIALGGAVAGIPEGSIVFEAAS